MLRDRAVSGDVRESKILLLPSISCVVLARGGGVLGAIWVRLGER